MIKYLRYKTIRVAGILMFLLFGIKTECPNNTYIEYDDSGNITDCKPCSKCKDGYFMTSPCTSSNNSVCEPCPDGYFYPGLSSPCTKCTICPKGTYLAQPCNETSNAVCKSCQVGYYSIILDAKMCSLCSLCPTYEKIVSPCSKTSDVTCTCSGVAYRDELTGQCLPCSRCTGQDQGQIVPECEQKLGQVRYTCQYVEPSAQQVKPDEEVDEDLRHAFVVGMVGLSITGIMLAGALIVYLHSRNKFTYMFQTLRAYVDRK